MENKCCSKCCLECQSSRGTDCWDENCPCHTSPKVASDEWQKTFLEAGSELLYEDLSAMIPVVSKILSSTIKEERELLIGEIEKLKEPNMSAMQKGSEFTTPRMTRAEGREMGIAEIINLIKSLS